MSELKKVDSTATIENVKRFFKKMKIQDALFTRLVNISGIGFDTLMDATFERGSYLIDPALIDTDNDDTSMRCRLILARIYDVIINLDTPARLVMASMCKYQRYYTGVGVPSKYSKGDALIEFAEKLDAVCVINRQTLTVYES